jgi:transposase
MCRQILKVEAALWTFVDTEGIEPTNNNGERKIRPAVLWRKGSFGTQGDRGSRFVERILTVATTCRQQNRSILNFLTEACEARLGGYEPPSLVPQDRSAEQQAA